MPVGDAVDTIGARKLLIQRILGSRYLNRSARLQDLLLYLADRVIDDGASEIHEQEVGRQVFGRPADYDTTSDNIVRVHASMLRKRLEQYFQEAGADEPVIIEIPKGNYAPVFRSRALAPIVEAPPPAPVRASRPTRLNWLLGALAALFALSTAYLLWRPAGPPTAPSASRPTVTIFWSQLFRSGTQTDIVVDDASVGVYQDVTGRSLRLAEYFDREYLRSLSSRDDRLLETVLRRQTTYADTAFLFKLLQMPGDRSRAVLRFARDYSVRELKTDNAILLGASRTNPWIEPFEPKLGLRWTYDVAAGIYRPSDTFAGGRQFAASDPAASHESYCGIAMLPNLGGAGNVLIVSGTGGSALTGAADFLADEASMAALRRLLPAKENAFPPFETLIKVNGRSALPRDKTIVFARTPPL
jgi:hypothetical protein